LGNRSKLQPTVNGDSPARGGGAESTEQVEAQGVYLIRKEKEKTAQVNEGVKNLRTANHSTWPVLKIFEDTQKKMTLYRGRKTGACK